MIMINKAKNNNSNISNTIPLIITTIVILIIVHNYNFIFSNIMKIIFVVIYYCLLLHIAVKLSVIEILRYHADKN